jgi:hypothetical protein
MLNVNLVLMTLSKAIITIIKHSAMMLIFVMLCVTFVFDKLNVIYHNDIQHSNNKRDTQDKNSTMMLFFEENSSF